MSRIIISVVSFSMAIGGIFVFGKLADKSVKQLALVTELPAVETLSLSPSSIPSSTKFPPALPAKSPPSLPFSTPNQDNILVVSNQPLIFMLKQNAELKIQTFPQSQCSIKVILPSGNTSAAKGLEAKTSDQSGYITWSWTISWNTQSGTGKIDLVCTKGIQKSSKSLQFTITSS